MNVGNCKVFAKRGNVMLAFRQVLEMILKPKHGSKLLP